MIRWTIAVVTEWTFAILLYMVNGNHSRKKLVQNPFFNYSYSSVKRNHNRDRNASIHRTCKCTLVLWARITQLMRTLTIQNFCRTECHIIPNPRQPSQCLLQKYRSNKVITCQGGVLLTLLIINRLHKASTVDFLLEMQFMVLTTVNFYRPQTKFAKVMFLHFTTGYGQRVGGACPTGMHSCFRVIFSRHINYRYI